MQNDLTLSDFIRSEVDVLLQDWEDFASTVLHAKGMDKAALRDHAQHMLLTIADDLESTQSRAEQAAKAKGVGVDVDKATWAGAHGVERYTSGFTVMETVSEFRALRASVVSHWTEANSKLYSRQLEELVRFDEAVDQAITASLEQYASAKDTETRRVNAILEASPDPIDLLDPSGRYIYVNPATADLFDLEPEDIVGSSNLDLGFPFAADLQRNLDKVVSDQLTCRGRLAHTFASGRGERFEYLLAPVLDKDGKTEAVVCIFRDVTQQMLAEERIWHAAHHDLLTTLPNRRLFMDRLKQEVKHAKRKNQHLAVLFMDIDGFKEVNDSFGHEVGDHLLCQVAERLTDCVREEDTVARMGGDEFTVILTGVAKRRDAELVAQGIVEAIAKPFSIAQRPVHATASIGISFYPENGSTPIELIQAADRAMYNAKRCDFQEISFSDTSATSDTTHRHAAK